MVPSSDISMALISLLFLPSPFKVKVLPTHDASKVKASGPGLNTTGVPASLPVEFTIDAKDAGEGLLAVQITVRRSCVIWGDLWKVCLMNVLGQLDKSSVLGGGLIGGHEKRADSTQRSMQRRNS